MSLTNYINLALCCLSVILSIISIITAVKTLKQNNEMIESSTRPYVCIYGDMLNFQDSCYYLVLKNFGKSGAVISDVTYSPANVFDSLTEYRNKPFDHISNTFLAPGQSFRFPINYKEIKKITNSINFAITYTSGKNIYNESTVLNLDVRLDTFSNKASTPNEELKIISYTFQEMVERSI